MLLSREAAEFVEELGELLENWESADLPDPQSGFISSYLQILDGWQNEFYLDGDSTSQLVQWMKNNGASPIHDDDKLVMMVGQHKVVTLRRMFK